VSGPSAAGGRLSRRRCSRTPHLQEHWRTLGQTTVPAGLSDVVAIAAGEFHSLALEGDGTVVAWGRNSHGQVDVPGRLTDVLERRRWSSIAGTRSGCDSLKTGAKW
jgi:hypothetical protein